MADTLDYYDLLGVCRDASSEEIKAAHRDCVRALHPDRHEEKIREVMDWQLSRINHAAQILLDPREREAYDRRLASRVPPDGGYYSGDDVRDYREYDSEPAAGGGSQEEDERPAEEEKVASATGGYGGLYETLIRPPAYADSVAAPVAYSVPYALIAIAPTWITGGSVSTPAVLFFAIWFIVIPVAALFLSAALSGVSAAFRGESFCSTAMLFGTHRNGGVDELPARRLELGVAALRLLWLGPAALIMLIAIGALVPGGFSIAPLLWLAALSWCVGRACVLWCSRR